jgi:hypothetical protein
MEGKNVRVLWCGRTVRQGEPGEPGARGFLLSGLCGPLPRSRGIRAPLTKGTNRRYDLGDLLSSSQNDHNA